MAQNLLRKLARNSRGMALIEFAFVAPPFLLILMAGFDVGHSLYLRSLLQGELQKAARDSTLQTGSETTRQAEIDQKVRDQVQNLHIGSTLTLDRKYFRSFDSAANPSAEPFTDTNGNSICDNGEPYTDQNNNANFDTDGKASGQGGARDVVVYEATLAYPRLFPLYGMLGWPANVEIKAATVLANQPYSAQATPTVRNCT